MLTLLQIVIKQDESLGPAPKVYLRDTVANRGTRIKVEGWVVSLRQQSKELMFLDLRDGTGFLQVVLTGDLAQW